MYRVQAAYHKQGKSTAEQRRLSLLEGKVGGTGVAGVESKSKQAPSSNSGTGACAQQVTHFRYIPSCGACDRKNVNIDCEDLLNFASFLHFQGSHNQHVLLRICNSC